MLHSIYPACLVCLFYATSSLAAGLARTPTANVLVIGSTSDQQLAERTLARTLAYRAEIARRWPSADATPVMVTVVVDPRQDRGLVWLRDCPERRFHKVWVYGAGDRIWAILRHEIAHCVMADAVGLPGRDAVKVAEFERAAETEEGRARP